MFNSIAGVFGAHPKLGVSGSASEMKENLLEAKKPMGFRFSFGALKLLGVTTSSGQFVESLELKDVVLQGGGDARAYRKALLESRARIEERLGSCASRSAAPGPRTDRIAGRIRALDKQRRGTQAELETLDVNEKEVLRLEALQKQSPGSLTRDDRLRLRRLKMQLSGAVLDVGTVGIKGIAGVAGFEHALTDVHGQGRSVNAALGLLSDSDKIKDFITGREGRPVVSDARGNDDLFKLDIGHVELSSLNLKGEVPSAEDARKDFERFEAKHEPWRKSHVEELERLKQRKELAEERRALTDPGITR
jgi:hypothetical protein